MQLLVLQQLPLRRLKVGRLDPVARHDARQHDANVGGAVEPPGPRAARKLLAQVRRKVVAVLGEEVVRGAEELVRHVADDAVNLLGRGQREAVQELALEGAARRLRLGLGPVYARAAALVVPAVGVFAAVDDDAGVEEGDAAEPEGGGEATGL